MLFVLSTLLFTPPLSWTHHLHPLILIATFFYPIPPISHLYLAFIFHFYIIISKYLSFTLNLFFFKYAIELLYDPVFKKFHNARFMFSYLPFYFLLHEHVWFIKYTENIILFMRLCLIISLFSNNDNCIPIM